MPDTSGPDGVAIRFQWSAGPRPVVLVHGFGSNAQVTWVDTGWVRALTEAQSGVLTLDLRGHGMSGKPAEPAAYSLELMAADVVAVMDMVGLSTVDVVGYSLGSRIALDIARSAPERVARLVLGGIGTEELFQSWNVDSIRSFLQDGTPVDDPLAMRLLSGAMSLPGADAAALLSCVEGLSGHGLRTTPPAQRALVVAGEADTAAGGAAILAAVLGAQFVSIPGRNHVNTLSARSFKQAALAFLD
ncbi:alpha/beta hydrolase [Parafrigoribacterium mesophilum]|uniref:alpha/beta fold hydrolase n=1 Tax=Parafrigoribacterium mesophilum TaxID=433646 RepID=UPI0031FC0155